MKQTRWGHWAVGTLLACAAGVPWAPPAWAQSAGSKAASVPAAGVQPAQMQPAEKTSAEMQPASTHAAAVRASGMQSSGMQPAAMQASSLRAPAVALVTAGAESSEPVDHLASPFPQPLPPSTRVRVAILDASTSLERAGRVAVLLTQFRRRDLEEHIGMKVEIANVSGIPEHPTMGNVVFYRPEFLRAAAMLALAIPGEQSVRVMPPERLLRSGVDVEIVLGEQAP